jgi:hypothetical protein
MGHYAEAAQHWCNALRTVAPGPELDCVPCFGELVDPVHPPLIEPSAVERSGGSEHCPHCGHPRAERWCRICKQDETEDTE